MDVVVSGSVVARVLQRCCVAGSSGSNPQMGRERRRRDDCKDVREEPVITARELPELQTHLQSGTIIPVC